LAKLNAPKGFDKSRLDGELLKKIEPFIDYVNQNFDQVLSAFASQISFGDNFSGKLIKLTAKHNTPITVANPTKAVSSLIPLFSHGFPVKSAQYSQNTDGSVEITLRFDGAVPIQTKNASGDNEITAFETKDLAEPGDLVSVTNYGEPAFNGEFLVLGVSTTTPRKVYCYTPDVTSATTETKSSYTSSETQTNEVTLFMGF